MLTFSDRYLTILAILFAVLFFTLPLAYWSNLFEAASLPRYFLIAVISSAALIIWSISSASRQIIWHPAFALILAFFGWAAISANWSPDPGTTLIDILQLFSMVLLAFLAMQLSVSPTFIKSIVPTILVGAALSAIVGIGQYFGVDPFEFRTNRNSIPATFINPNHAAVYFDFIPWLAFTAILSYQRRSFRWLAAACLGLCLAYILINTSRGAWLALLVSGVVFIMLIVFKSEARAWIKSRLRQRHKEITLALLIPAIVLLGPLFQASEKPFVARPNTSLLQGKLDASSSYRLAMYANSLPAIFEHPLSGLGYGGIRVGFQPYTSSVLPTTFRTEDTVLRELHSDPLQYFVELGIPGGLLALAIFLILLRTGWTSFSSPRLKPIRFHVLGFWLGLIACGSHALVDFPLRLPASAAMFWLFAGILLGWGRISRKNKLTLTMRRPYQLVVAVTGIISLLISLFFYKAYLSANNDLYHALVNLQKGNCVAAAQHSQQGFETFASDFMLHTAHAQIYSFCNFPPQQKLEAMNRVLKHDPTNMRARLTRAVLYSEANRPDLAIPEFQVIAKILPHQPYAYMGLGDSARQQGDRIKARFYYQAALKRKPDYQYVKEQLSRLNAESEQQK